MKFRCTVCGHIYDEEKEGVKFADLPADWTCPTCKQPKEKFVPVEGEKVWACEHVLGVASDAPEDIKADLKACFEGECTEVGMYLAMSRVAIREGYPEIGAFYEKAAMEEAQHAAMFAEMLGDVVYPTTKENLEARAEAEYGATAARQDIAARAKKLNLDAIHDAVHEIGRDEARHGRAFEGLLKRYFGK